MARTYVFWEVANTLAQRDYKMPQAVVFVGEEDDMSYQTVTGALSPGGHPGSYNGQDAYNDMLVTDGRSNDRQRADAQRGDEPGGESAGLYARRPGDFEGGVLN